jgi:hypothetical protein
MPNDYVAIPNKALAQRILHMRGILRYIEGKGNELADDTGSSNFEVIMSENTEYFRPRVYVAPANSDGIREELSQAVLLKAALGMAGR